MSTVQVPVPEMTEIFDEQQLDGQDAGDPSNPSDHAARLAQKLSKKRTKTGCLTCRKRRIKCGEEKPVCNNCIKSKRLCEGYNQRVVFKRPAGAFGPAGPFDQHDPYSDGVFYGPGVGSGPGTALHPIAPRPLQPLPGHSVSYGMQYDAAGNLVPVPQSSSFPRATTIWDPSTQSQDYDHQVNIPGTTSSSDSPSSQTMRNSGQTTVQAPSRHDSTTQEPQSSRSLQQSGSHGKPNADDFSDYVDIQAQIHAMKNDRAHCAGKGVNFHYSLALAKHATQNVLPTSTALVFQSVLHLT